MFRGNMDAIEIRSVTKTFATVTAVNDLSLAIPEGSIYGFIGPNGSGKTTTMRMIAGIFHPDRGTIHVFGKDVSTERAGLIGYLPEERGLYKKMKVRSLLEFHAISRASQASNKFAISAKYRNFASRTRVTSFSIAKPSLQDIFIRIAGPEAALPKPELRKILLIAQRDYLAAIRTKAFLSGLLVVPILFGGGFLGTAVINRKPDISRPDALPLWTKAASLPRT
jgi:ABC-type uncharacterized transport system ATPase subunit